MAITNKFSDSLYWPIVAISALITGKNVAEKREVCEGKLKEIFLGDSKQKISELLLFKLEIVLAFIRKLQMMADDAGIKRLADNHDPEKDKANMKLGLQLYRQFSFCDDFSMDFMEEFFIRRHRNGLNIATKEIMQLCKVSESFNTVSRLFRLARKENDYPVENICRMLIDRIKML